jgi:hypothetical protein
MLRSSFDCRVVCAEEKEEQTDLRRPRFWDDQWKQDLSVFYVINCPWKGLYLLCSLSTLLLMEFIERTSESSPNYIQSALIDVLKGSSPAFLLWIPASLGDTFLSISS